MKNVTGVGILFFLVLILLSKEGVGQGLSPEEKQYFKQISDSLTVNQNDFRLVDSFLHLINNYSVNLKDTQSKRDLQGLYCAEYVFIGTSMITPFDTASIKKFIDISEGCLSTYKDSYKSGVWTNSRYDILLLRGLVYLYTWSRMPDHALGALKEYEKEVLEFNDKSYWELLDIYTMYADFYGNMGLYQKESDMNRLIIDGYKQGRFYNVNDSLKFITALSGLIKYDVRTYNIDSAIEHLNEYEHYYNLIHTFQKSKTEHAAVLEDMSRLSINYSLEYAKEYIQEAETSLRQGNLDSTDASYTSLCNAKLDLYQALGEWKNIAVLINNNEALKITSSGLLLEALLHLKQREAALSVIDYINNDLYQDLRGLENFSPSVRAKAIQRITKSRNFRNCRKILLAYPFDSVFINKFRNYLFRYKAVEISLNNNYSKALGILKNDSLEVLVRDKIKANDILIEISRISQSNEIKAFYDISNGISFKFTPDKLYPYITDIAPYTYAFQSGLKINDVIVSINGESTQQSDSVRIIKMFNSVPVGKLNLVEIMRYNAGDKMTFFTRRDSAFHRKDTLESKYVFYYLNGNDPNFNYIITDAKNIDYNIKKQYSRSKSADLGNDLKRVLSKVKLASNIYLSDDGLFNMINPETLQITDSTGKAIYLGDLFSFHLMSSVRDLLKDRSVINKSQTITLFGYPDYLLEQGSHIELVRKLGYDSTSLSFNRSAIAITGDYIFTPLPATKHEVEDISEIFRRKGWKVQEYMGPDALEEKVKKIQSPQILHIATHGFFASDLPLGLKGNITDKEIAEFWDNPMIRSGLAFAGAERTRRDGMKENILNIDDGILTADEAQSINLDSTELVVLSACETGLGDLINGEGVYGLQRAFLAAGAQSILMSLWKVDDLATETLMKSFYRHWLDDGMNKHDALWQAKLDLRHDKNHPDWAKPFYWGSFVLIGE